MVFVQILYQNLVSSSWWFLTLRSLSNAEGTWRIWLIAFWLWAKYYFSRSIISLVKIETSPIAFFSRKVSEKYPISDTILWNWASHILTNKKGKCRKKVNVLQASRFLSLKITELKIQRVSSRFLSFSKKGKCIWAQRQKIGDHYLRRLEKTSQTRQI